MGISPNTFLVFFFHCIYLVRGNIVGIGFLIFLYAPTPTKPLEITPFAGQLFPQGHFVPRITQTRL